MRFGVNTLLWTAGFDREHVPLLEPIRAHGFDTVEIARFEWQSYPGSDVRREVEKVGLEAVYCSAFTGSLSLASDDAAVRGAALEFLRGAISTVGDLGGRKLVGPFCAPVGYLCGRRRTDAEWSRVVEGLQSVGPLLEQAGVTLCLEPLNRFETYFLNTAADAARLCDEIGHPQVGILYDTFHANIEEKSQAAGIAAAARHLRHFHACENDRGTPGSGHVEWSSVFQALRAAGYESHIVIESFGFAIKEIAAAACIWRDLADSPEQIAWGGVQFLKSQ